MMGSIYFMAISTSSLLNCQSSLEFISLVTKGCISSRTSLKSDGEKDENRDW